MELFFIIAVPLAIALLVWGLFDSQASKGSIQQEIANLEDFNPAHVWYAGDWSRAMALDSGRRRLALVQRAQGRLRTRIIEAHRIVSAEVIEDGSSLMKTARMGQLGGAAVGGLIFGPLGAVVGGLSGGKRQIDKARRIDLDIVVDDMIAPRFSANFLGTEADKSGFVYRASIDAAREWAARIDALIHGATNGNPPAGEPRPPPAGE